MRRSHYDHRSARTQLNFARPQTVESSTSKPSTSRKSRSLRENSLIRLALAMEARAMAYHRVGNRPGTWKPRVQKRRPLQLTEKRRLPCHAPDRSRAGSGGRFQAGFWWPRGRYCFLLPRGVALRRRPGHFRLDGRPGTAPINRRSLIYFNVTLRSRCLPSRSKLSVSDSPMR